MRKRLIAAAFVAATVLGAGSSLVSGGNVVAAPGPNGHNDYGLCKAYSVGSDNKNTAPPFAALEAAAKAANQTVAEFCANKTPGGK
jgi:hypothetical protein